MVTNTTWEHLLAAVALAGMLLGAGCTTSASARSEDTNEHKLHSRQEHYDRGGYIPDKQ